MIVAGLMVAPSAPLGWVEYIRAGDDAMLHVRRRKRRGESCACRATCLDIVGLEKKGGGSVNDARNEARVVDLGKMAKCACFEGNDAGLLLHLVGRLAQTQVPSLSYRGSGGS